jgi:hypothetical protein
MPITLIRDPNETTVGADGYVAVASLATSMPTDIADCIPDEVLAVDLAAGFADLGLLTDAGPRASFGRTVKDIPAWQSLDPVRSLVTAVPKQIEFDLEQWNEDNLSLGLGGSVVTDTTTGVMLEPEDDSFLNYKRLIIYAEDGGKHYAFCFRRTQNVKALTFPFGHEDISALPIGMKVLKAPSGEGKAWYMLTDDPAFATGS